jgi:putative effector of murein hydrolase LrgA (UPF0299 family)
MSGENPKTLGQRFFMFCLLMLGGIIALTLALDFFARIWGWLLLIGLLVCAVWVAIVVLRARRSRW